MLTTIISVAKAAAVISLLPLAKDLVVLAGLKLYESITEEVEA